MWIPVRDSWRLNERHYGALQGLNKAETAAKFGERAGARSGAAATPTPPPALAPDDERHPARDPRYASLTEGPAAARPSRSKDTVARFLPYWHDRIVPDVQAGQRVLIAAHGNSLRALVKHLDGMSEDGDRRAQHPDGHPARLRARRRPEAAPAAATSAIPKRRSARPRRSRTSRRPEAALPMTATAASGRRRRWPLVVAGALVALALAAGAAGTYLRARVRASLPLVSGEAAVAGLGAPVRIERDARGVPVVRGASRADVARATGFLHAQDRYFQMDLTRRRAAGELAEIFGAGALAVDRETRVYRMRDVARRAVEALPAGERVLLAAYTEGVGAGLAALGAPPPEYLLLRAVPAPWKEEDALLCALAMFLTLQGELAGQESGLGLMHDVLPPPLFEFLAPLGTEWDAPLEGEAFDAAARSRAGDLGPAQGPRARAGASTRRLRPRAGRARVRQQQLGGRGHAHDARRGAPRQRHAPRPRRAEHLVPRLARVPEGGAERRVTGVTLPGAPVVVVGSNGHVAWGFTNSQGDWADLVELEADPHNKDAYLTPEGPRAFDRARETIRVKGQADETLEVVSSDLGPGGRHGPPRPAAGARLGGAARGRLNAALLRMETARGP